MQTHGGSVGGGSRVKEPREWKEAWQFTEAWPPMGQAVQHAAGSDVQDDVPLLFALACEIGAKTIIELGTRQGTSTRTLRMAAELLDAWFMTADPDPGCWNFIKDYAHPRYCQFANVTGEYLFGARDQYPQPDLLFIDTDPHTYDQTAMWLDTWVLHGLKPGGVAAFHDTVPARPEIEVGRAVREWVATHPEYLWREIPTTYGIGILWKP